METPLLVACSRDDIGVAKALLIAKANVDGHIEDAEQSLLLVTPLMEAAEFGSPEVCHFD